MEDTNPLEDVNVTNEFGLSVGNNLPNHSRSVGGRTKYVTPVQHPIFRTKQSAYRFMGYLESLAEVLPDEDKAHTREQVLKAIREI